jgi:hypothetical protein
MCGSCEEGYFLDASSRDCSVCSMEGVLESMVTIGLLAGGLLVLFLVHKSGGVPVPRSLVEKRGWPGRLQVPLVGGLLSIDGGAMKVVWSTLQIVTSISGSLDFTYPEPFASFTDLFSFIKISFISIDCVADKNYHDEVYATSAFPLMLCTGVLASYVARVALNAKLTRSQRAHGFSAHAGAALLVTYLVLPKVATVQLQGLNCLQLRTGEAYLKADTSIDCNGEDHQRFIIFNVLLILLYQAIPIGYLVVLLKNKKRLQPASAATDEVAMLVSPLLKVLPRISCILSMLSCFGCASLQ